MQACKCHKSPKKLQKQFKVIKICFWTPLATSVWNEAGQGLGGWRGRRDFTLCNLVCPSPRLAVPKSAVTVLAGVSWAFASQDFAQLFGPGFHREGGDLSGWSFCETTASAIKAALSLWGKKRVVGELGGSRGEAMWLNAGPGLFTINNRPRVELIS